MHNPHNLTSGQSYPYRRQDGILSGVVKQVGREIHGWMRTLPLHGVLQRLALRHGLRIPQLRPDAAGIRDEIVLRVGVTLPAQRQREVVARHNHDSAGPSGHLSNGPHPL